MSCFSLLWLQQLLVYCVIIAAVIAIIKLLIPFLSGLLHPVVGQALQIVLWAVVAIVVIYVIFALLSCLLGMGGGLRLH